MKISAALLVLAAAFFLQGGEAGSQRSEVHQPFFGRDIVKVVERAAIVVPTARSSTQAIGAEVPTVT